METLILQQKNLHHPGGNGNNWTQIGLGMRCSLLLQDCLVRLLMTSGVGCDEEQLVTTEEDTDMECDAAPVLLPGNKQGNLNVEGAKLYTRPLVDITACWAAMVEPRLPAILVRGWWPPKARTVVASKTRIWIMKSTRQIAGWKNYGVATISRLLKIIGLFCKRAL